MPKGCIFISYRRGADNHSAGRLYDRLEGKFGAERLFIDVDAIPPGIDFVEHLSDKVAECDAFLAIIGNGWVRDLPRLQDPTDFVRIEIEAALNRSHIPVIPVLIDDASMPAAEELPESVRPLVRRAGIAVRHENFSATVDGRLTEALRRAVNSGGKLPEAERLTIVIPSRVEEKVQQKSPASSGSSTNNGPKFNPPKDRNKKTSSTRAEKLNVSSKQSGADKKPYNPYNSWLYFTYAVALAAATYLLRLLFE